MHKTKTSIISWIRQRNKLFKHLTLGIIACAMVVGLGSISQLSTYAGVGLFNMTSCSAETQGTLQSFTISSIENLNDKEVGPCASDDAGVWYSCKPVGVFVDQLPSQIKVTCQSQGLTSALYQDCTDFEERGAWKALTFGGTRKLTLNSFDETKCKAQDFKALCTFYWDKKVSGSIFENAVSDSCKERFNNVNPNVSIEKNNGSFITTCVPLTEADKKSLDDKYKSNPAFETTIGSDYSKACKDQDNKIFIYCEKTKDGTSCKLGANTAAKNSITDSASVATVNGEGQNKVIEILLEIVTGIVAIILYLIGLLVQVIFWMIANVFLILVRINPASASFLEVARAPWSIIVQLANLVILGSFMFVGFGYLLGLKYLKAKQNTASDFLMNIVIIAITIQLTLTASATFINVFQGVGDLVYVSYVRGIKTVNNQGDEVKGNDTVISNMTSALQKTSALRCGNIGKTDECLQPSGIEAAQNFGKVLGEGNNLTVAIREAMYIIVMGYAIFIFIGALRLALTRAVGLWFLMITSPMALVLYLSPFDGLKKYSMQWIQLFWQMSIFYPAFVFGLVIINSLSGAFADAANSAAASNASLGLNGGETLGGVSAYAAEATNGELLGVVFTILGAIISIFALQLLIKFFDDGFGKIAGSVLSGVTGGIGAGARMLGGAVGLAGRASGIVRDASADRKLKTLEREINKTRSDSGIAPAVKTAKLNQLRQQVSNIEQSSANRKTRREKNVLYKGTQALAGSLSRAADYVEVAPALLSLAGQVPAGFLGNYTKQREAREARDIAGTKAAVERTIRGNSLLYGALEGVGYEIDAEPNLSMFAGVNPTTMGALKSKYGKNYFEEETASKINDIYKSKLGLKNEYDREVSDILLDELSEKTRNGTITSTEKTQLKDLLKKSLQDTALRSKILNDKTLTDEVRKNFNQLDAKSQETINDKAPSLLPTVEERVTAGGRIASSPERLREVDRDTLQDKDIREGYFTVNGDSAEAYKAFDERSKLNGYSGIGDQAARTDYDVQDLESAMRESISTPDAGKNLDNLYDNINRRVSQKGYSAENDIVAGLAQIDASDLSEADKNIKREALYQKADARIFGAGVIQKGVDAAGNEEFTLDKAAINSMTLDQLKDTEIGKEAMKNGLLTGKVDGKLLTDDQQKAMLRANIARAAVNNNYNRPTTNAKIGAYSKKAGDSIQTYRGETTLLNTQRKGLAEVIKQNNGYDMLQTGGGPEQMFFKTLGAQKEFDKISDSMLTDGVVVYGNDPDPTKNKSYNFSDLSGSQRKQTLGKINQAMASAIGGKALPADFFKGAPEAESFYKEQIENKSSELQSSMIKRGSEDAALKIQKIKKTTPKGTAPTEIEANDVLGKSIESITSDISKRKQSVQNSNKVISEGVVSNALIGQATDNYQGGNINLGGGGGFPNTSGSTGGSGGRNNIGNGNKTPSNTNRSYESALNRNMDRMVKIKDISGAELETSMEDVIRDYHSGNQKYQYTDEIVKQQQIDAFRVEDNGAISSRNSATKAEYQAGNSAYASAGSVIDTGNFEADVARAYNEQANKLADENFEFTQPNTVPYQTEYTQSGSVNAGTSNKQKTQSPEQQRVDKFNNSKAVKSGKIDFDSLSQSTQSAIQSGTGFMTPGKARRLAEDSTVTVTGVQAQAIKAQLERDRTKDAQLDAQIAYQNKEDNGVVTNRDQVVYNQAQATAQKAEQEYKAISQKEQAALANQKALQQQAEEAKKYRDTQIQSGATVVTTTNPQYQTPNIPTINANRISEAEAKANVNKYVEASRQNEKMKAYNELPESTRLDIAQGGRDSIGSIKESIASVDAVINKQQTAQTAAQQAYQATEESIANLPKFFNKTKSNINRVSASIEAENKFKQAAAILNENIEVNKKAGVDAETMAKLNQNYQKMHNQNIENSKNARTSRISNTNKYNDVVMGEVDKVQANISKIESQNESLHQNLQANIKSHQDELNKRMANRGSNKVPPAQAPTVIPSTTPTQQPPTSLNYDQTPLRAPSIPNPGAGINPPKTPTI
jgi:hypothetical protein